MTDAQPVLELRPVTLANYYEVMKLEMAPGQERFLDSNAWPLAEAAYVTGFTPEAVYLDGTLIGLVSWGPYYPGYAYDEPPETGSLIIDHVMIDQPHQGMGLGRRLVTRLIDKLATRPDCRRIVLMLDPQNHIADRLYTSLGFTQFGVTHEDDRLMALDVA
ncbi:MAG: hypothetical protein CMM46_00690 [Rhodospirillaceae bacterium]|nr:hypothetical protein [Rhodospirillaceae bacterium]|tara:strand:+ start:4835 stop:5317 length:483 start_codon:yes stop_codon:yes gene_type:complete